MPAFVVDGEADELNPFVDSQNVVGEWSPRVVVCSGPIGYDDTQIKRDISNFKAALDQVDVAEAFMPVVAPASTAYNGINEYYPSEREYVFAIADALKQEYRAIYEAGIANYKARQEAKANDDAKGANNGDNKLGLGNDNANNMNPDQGDMKKGDGGNEDMSPEQKQKRAQRREDRPQKRARRSF